MGKAYEGFNSIVVRLKDYFKASRSVPEIGFNSIVVRLKAQTFDGETEANNSFNSIVVRLKVEMPMQTECLNAWFQFHSGSIKSQKFVEQRRITFLVSIP